MVFITILLFAVAYIFAIVGVVFFESYSIPDRPDLNYQHSFRSDSSCKRLKCCNCGTNYKLHYYSRDPETSIV